ncbi:glycosyltransferase family 4 protein [[Limnothrix rosea] IAM M-220]|uniref:glycosyltransferase family 4 protein n=1 Tax=[Limnothrix rosea] IAM M-220 TaxID=454133 RepID=UPI000963EB5A|nr:glycosyltransferase family 4 protein [[Limnothrix rosea] IAM M-220]OKH19908.1 group 1 glycosyl transferase [[Limnothrix rosea] IAM M-220]
MSQSPIRATFYSILPSPYQRDLFAAIAARPDIDLQVKYLEMTVDDSPWPQKELQAYESVLPGKDLRWGSSRFHINWHLPNFADTDVVVLNGYQSSVSQWILRTQAGKIPCVFWGEKIVGAATGVKGKMQKNFADSLSNCQAIAAIGAAAVEDYKQRYPNMPVHPIPYYCTLRNFQDNIPQRPRDPINIFFCGQMIARKGVDLLLQSFSQIIDQGFNATLTLVGREAELPEFMAAIPEKTQEKVIYKGFQAPETLPKFFNEADIFVLPSRYDGWGVVVNQAVGAGLPIVCSDAVGSAADLVKDNGIIFEAGNQAKLYEALLTYISNPEKLTAASKASYANSADWYPEVGAERWANLFRQVLA